MDDNAHCKLIFGALREDGISVTVTKKSFKNWLASVSSLRGMAHRKGFGLSVQDCDNVFVITRKAKGVQGRPFKKDIV